MPVRKQEFAKKGVGSTAVVNFRPVVSATSSQRRGSAVLPSVLTFAVIVASGGLLLMIEKGMLNNMETPPPRGNGKNANYLQQVRHPDASVDVDSQVSAYKRLTSKIAE